MVTLRDMLPTDLREVSALGIRSKASWGYGQGEMAIFSGELTLDGHSLAGCLAAKVAMLDQRVVGYFTLRKHDDGGIELEHMFVDPDHFGQGVGKHLFESALEVAGSDGARELMLISDPNASGFYEKQGAKVTGEHQSSISGRTIPVMTIPIQ